MAIIVIQGMEGLPLLQEFSCAENHLPKVDGLASCSLLQHLRLSQNNLQLVQSYSHCIMYRKLTWDILYPSSLSPPVLAPNVQWHIQCR